MIFNKSVSIKCPMCDHKNVISTYDLRNSLNAEEGRPFIFLCNLDNGGCDRYFVVQINLTANIHTYIYRPFVTPINEVP